MEEKLKAVETPKVPAYRLNNFVQGNHVVVEIKLDDVRVDAEYVRKNLFLLEWRQGRAVNRLYKRNAKIASFQANLGKYIKGRAWR